MKEELFHPENEQLLLTDTKTRPWRIKDYLNTEPGSFLHRHSKHLSHGHQRKQVKWKRTSIPGTGIAWKAELFVSTTLPNRRHWTPLFWSSQTQSVSPEMENVRGTKKPNATSEEEAAHPPPRTEPPGPELAPGCTGRAQAPVGTRQTLGTGSFCLRCALGITQENF